MGYTGASEAQQARETLGRALEALQQDENVPEEALGVAQNIAQSVGALFEAERASTEPDGKTCVKNALSTLSQTLALLQDVKSEHPGVLTATESIAEVLSSLFPLTNKPSVMPRPSEAAKASAAPSAAPSKAPSSAPAASQPPVSETPSSGAPPSNAPASQAPKASSAPPPKASSAPPKASSTPPKASSAPPKTSSAPPKANSIPLSMLPPAAPEPSGPRQSVEANIGATTQSNFYVGFSGEIAHGGVFLATYEVLRKDASVRMLVTLPGGYEFECDGYIRFVRDPMDLGSESEPGMGIQFENLSDEARDLVLRFIRKRAPMFYDV